MKLYYGKARQNQLLQEAEQEGRIQKGGQAMRSRADRVSEQVLQNFGRSRNGARRTTLAILVAGAVALVAGISSQEAVTQPILGLEVLCSPLTRVTAGIPFQIPLMVKGGEAELTMVEFDTQGRQRQFGLGRHSAGIQQVPVSFGAASPSGYATIVLSVTRRVDRITHYAFAACNFELVQAP